MGRQQKRAKKSEISSDITANTTNDMKFEEQRPLSRKERRKALKGKLLQSNKSLMNESKKKAKYEIKQQTQSIPEESIAKINTNHNHESSIEKPAISENDLEESDEEGFEEDVVSDVDLHVSLPLLGEFQSAMFLSTFISSLMFETLPC